MTLLFDRWKRRGAQFATDLLRVTGCAPEELAGDMQVIDARNVYEWCVGRSVGGHGVKEGARDHGVISAELHCCPAPFPKTWVELGKDGAQAWGAYAFCDDAGALWIFHVFEQHGTIRLLGGTIVPLSSDLRPDLSKSMFYAAQNFSESDGERAVWEGSWNMLCCLTAFQLMACPDEHVPRELARPTAGERRAYRRRFGVELANYYTLDIGPTWSEQFEKSIDEDEVRMTGKPPRLHWVRGHFKRGSYVTPELPQGRYTRPFLRGSSESGIISKAYNVVAPLNH